jgi:hypothetical protein
MFIALLSMLGLMAIAATMHVARDMSSNILAANTIHPVSVAANKAKDTGVSVLDFDAAMFIANFGAVTGAGILLAVAQECPTLGGTYTDVAAADLSGAFVNSTANSIQKVGYKGVQPFLAVRFILVSGTSQLASAVIEGRYAHARPVA